MNKPILRKVNICASLAACIFILIAACNKEAPETTAPLAGEEARSAVIFDQKRHKGLLTVRYFHLQNVTPTGDCILIQTPDGKTMMIDAGVPETADQVIEYLNRLGVDTIDVALNTHPHHDHMGGFAKVIAAKDVQTFYTMFLSVPDYSSNSYRAAATQLNLKKIPREVLEEGMTFRLGDQVTVEVFSPDKGSSAADVKSHEDAVINFYSLVFKVVYKDTSFLFSGDIYVDRERMLIDKYGEKLRSDMMHAPHHGSSSSNSEAFIKTVKPKIAVISFHQINSDGFMTYLRYRKLGAQVYHTGVNGNILITSDGKQLNVFTEKDAKFK